MTNPTPRDPLAALAEAICGINDYVACTGGTTKDRQAAICRLLHDLPIQEITPPTEHTDGSNSAGVVG